MGRGTALCRGLFAVAVFGAVLVAWSMLRDGDRARSPSAERRGPPSRHDPVLVGVGTTSLTTKAESEATTAEGTPATEVSKEAARAAGRATDDPALPPGRHPLDVIVVDGMGRPVPRAWVVGRWGEWQTRPFTTGEQGTVRMSVPPATQGLWVIGQGRPSTGSYVLVHALALPRGATRARVVLNRWLPVSGVVRVDGRPVTGGAIQGYGFPSDVERGRKGEKHDGVPFFVLRYLGACAVGADGRFSMGVPSDLLVTLVYTGEVADRFVHAVASRVRPSADDVVLHAGEERNDALLDVTVLRPDGHPARGARVEWHPAAGSGWPAASPDPPAVPIATTDETGRVTIEGLDARGWRVQVAPGEDADVAWAGGSQIALAGGDPVVLRLGPPPALLQGIVVDDGDRPVGGAWVCAMRDGMWAACMKTDPEGRFRGSSNVPPGTRLQVVARYPMDDPTARAYENDVLAGDGPLTLRLEEIGPLTASPR